MKLSDMTERVSLDLGCGLKPHERANIVVDINPIISELGENIHKIVHDLNKIPYPFADNSVDEIHCYYLLEHLQIHSFDFLRECYRILKPNGVLFLRLPNAFNYKTRLRFLFGNYIIDSSFHPFHIKLLKPSYLVKHLRYLGFDVKLNTTTSFWRRIRFEQILPDVFALEIRLEARKRP